MTATTIASSIPDCRKSGSWKTTAATIASMTGIPTVATTIGVTMTGGTMIAGMTTAAMTIGGTTVAMVAAGTRVTIAGTVAIEILAIGIRATAGITNA